MKDPFSPKRLGLRLKPLQVAGFQEPLDLVEGKLTIGRAEGNDVVLRAETFPSVSSTHLRIQQGEQGRLVVRDLGSKNGTLVNGERIEERQLAVGDVVQLGAIGPRFVVVSSEPLSETMFVDPKQLRVSEGEVEQMVRSRARRQGLRFAVLGLVAALGLAWWARELFDEGRQEVELKNQELAAKLQEAERLRADEMARVEAEHDAYVEALRAQMEEGEAEAEELRGRLATLEETGASADEISRLEGMLETTRGDLEAARASLTLVDPVNLEAARLSGVSHVRAAVVLIEAELTLTQGDRTLYLDASLGPNWDDAGEPWTQESTGTGFVVSQEGYVMTNAHVVEPSEDSHLVISARESGLTPKVQLYAVFDGDMTRHPLEVVEVATGVDLALGRIQPFEDMPHLPEFSIDVPPPPVGSDVYLMGFPLGNFAIQEGRRVHASTFRGILSRIVDDNLQVDAGVHPGNSGGPITDPSGRVIGVVFSVQATPDQTAVYTIGYGIPIERARQLWPPEADAGSGDEPATPDDE